MPYESDCSSTVILPTNLPLTEGNTSPQYSLNNSFCSSVQIEVSSGSTGVTGVSPPSPPSPESGGVTVLQLASASALNVNAIILLFS